MPRKKSYPVLINDLLRINVASILNQAKPNEIMLISWSENDEVIASLKYYKSIQGCDYVYFYYCYKGDSFSCQIGLTYTTSNLGIGKIPFFVCPVTLAKCRRLYLFQGRLVSRNAIRFCLYESQTWSKTIRRLYNTFGEDFLLDELYDQIYQPYFKKTYRAKPTQLLLKISQKIAILEHRNQDEVLKDILDER
ncbi:hypothetical protein OAD50_01370 [Vicingaceae bacterium]|nr:hypothetical protein [Vicingaceae bacterium]